MFLAQINETGDMAGPRLPTRDPVVCKWRFITLLLTEIRNFVLWNIIYDINNAMKII